MQAYEPFRERKRRCDGFTLCKPCKNDPNIKSCEYGDNCAPNRMKDILKQLRKTDHKEHMRREETLIDIVKTLKEFNHNRNPSKDDMMMETIGRLLTMVQERQDRNGRLLTVVQERQDRIEGLLTGLLEKQDKTERLKSKSVEEETRLTLRQERIERMEIKKRNIEKVLPDITTKLKNTVEAHRLSRFRQ